MLFVSALIKRIGSVLLTIIIKNLGYLTLICCIKKYSIAVILKNHSPFDSNIIKRAFLKYDLNVLYSKKKVISQKFVDYLRPKYFNYLNNNFKKYLRFNSNININTSLSNYFIFELVNSRNFFVFCHYFFYVFISFVVSAYNV